MTKPIEPHSLDAEKAVLGAVLVRNESALLVPWLKPEHFFRKAHRTLWTAMLALLASGEAVDTLTLRTSLQIAGELEDVGGLAYIAALVEGMPRSANIEAYGRIVIEKAKLRGLAAAARAMALQAEQEDEESSVLLDEAQRTLLALTEGLNERGLMKADALLAELLPKLEDILNTKRPVTGVATGFHAVDGMTRGLQPGELTIVAARPSMGKTSLAGNVAEHVAGQGLGVAFFSLEMTRDQVMLRMLASHSRLDLHRLLTGYINQSEYAALRDSMAHVSSLPFYVDDWSSPTLLELRAASRRMQSRDGLELVIVDYIGLMPTSGKAENRNLALGEVSRGLKTLAKELRAPVMALSQLSRACEQRADKRPMLSDLRESGNLEQDADLVWFLYRDEVYHPQGDNAGQAELIIAKNRNGPTGAVRLHFNKAATRFENVTDSWSAA